MPEITLKVTQDQLNMLQAALNAFVIHNQQHAAMLANSLQSQVQSQIAPLPNPPVQA